MECDGSRQEESPEAFLQPTQLPPPLGEDTRVWWRRWSLMFMMANSVFNVLHYCTCSSVELRVEGLKHAAVTLLPMTQVHPQ